jgi:MFS family permease
MNMPTLELTLLFAYLTALSGSIRISAMNTLALEQIPAFQGTMMSLYKVASNVANAIGTGVGGILLVYTNYQLLGLVFGPLAIIASVIFHFHTIDPALTRHESLRPEVEGDENHPQRSNE